MRVAVDLIDSDRVNAVALPDGRILVTRGLLALARSEAEVAAVLAHEIGHVVATTPGCGRSGRRPTLISPGRRARPISTRRRSGRPTGSESRPWAAAGYDPGAAPAFLARLDADHRLAAALVGRPELASAAANGADHPETADRVAAARTQAAALPGARAGRRNGSPPSTGCPGAKAPARSRSGARP